MEQAQGLLATALAAGLLDPHGRAGVVGPVRVAAYIASPGEPDVGGIRRAVRAAGGAVLLPIPLRGRVLAWAPDDGRYADDPRLPVAIPRSDPVGTGAAALGAARIDLLLVPALAVDRAGLRLGQGGGYYDELLAQVGPGTTVLAVVHDEEVLQVGDIPAHPHDQSVPGVLTPTRVLWFRQPDGQAAL